MSLPTPARLPGGAALAPGETALIAERFMLSTIGFYMHTDIALTNRRLAAVRPNTLLGLIPVGTRRANFPIESIAAVNAATMFSVPAFLVGLLAGLAGFAGLSSRGSGGGGIVLLLIGVALVLSAPRQAVELMNSGGGTIRFPVAVFERGRTVDFANRVSEAIARLPGSRHEERQPIAMPAGNDPREAIGNLNRLRDEGLIDADEYAAKRAEILARL